jgi:hypothetical protein
MSASISALEVTYGGALGSAKFRRVVAADGNGADLARGGPDAVALWYKRGDGGGDPVTGAWA